MRLSSDDETDPFTHVIVSFKGEMNTFHQRLVELIPMSWLGVKDNQHYCVYPSKDEYESWPEWVKNSKRYSGSWLKISAK